MLSASVRRERIIAYVDGFNLYYSVLKGTPYKWLDLEQLFCLLFPKDEVVAIKYFTAKVKPRPNDPDQPIRQALYLRALGTLPKVEIIYGTFLSHKTKMPLANPQNRNNPFVWVIKTEEKGSDVNLATHLLYDAFVDAFDVAIVVSNDSDLLLPIQVVREKLGKKVGLVGYDLALLKKYGRAKRHPNPQLRQSVDFYKTIREGALRRSQFAPVLKDAQGTFQKPRGW